MILKFIKSGFNLSQINDNFNTISNAFDKQVLYRAPPSGQANQMEVDLDMNGKQILNIAPPSSPTSLVRYQDLIEVVAGGAFASQIQVDTSQGLTGPNVQTALDSLWSGLKSVTTLSNASATQLGIMNMQLSTIDARVTAIENAPDPGTIFSTDVRGSGRFGLDNKGGMFNYDAPANIGTAGDNGQLRSTVDVSYGGGTTASTSANILSVRNITGSPQNNQRGIWSELTNFASGTGQFTGIFSAVNKRGNTAMYGLVSQFDDYTSATSPAMGAFVVMRGSTTDPTAQRRGLMISVENLPSTSTQHVVSKGLYLATSPNSRVQHAIHNAAVPTENVFLNTAASGGGGITSVFRNTGANYSYGLNFQGSSFGYSAINLNTTGSITWDGDLSAGIRRSEGWVDVFGPVRLGYGGYVRVDGPVFAGASSGTGLALPANPQGYLQLNINGAQFKVPFYPM